MKSRALIFSSLCLAMAGVGSSASGQARPIPNRVVPGNSSIVFYDQTSYQGANANFTSSTANVGSQWRRGARSVTVNGGTWQVCENPNFNGQCVTLSQNVADLGSYNLRRIGSVRPVRSGRRVTGTLSSTTEPIIAVLPGGSARRSRISDRPRCGASPSEEGDGKSARQKLRRRLCSSGSEYP